MRNRKIDKVLLIHKMQRLNTDKAKSATKFLLAASA